MRRGAAALGSTVFFLLAPCVVAGVRPWVITHWDVAHTSVPWRIAHILGVVAIVDGTAVLLYCFVWFVADGGGTPAPVAPTESLVVSGAYSFVRNPMYVAVTAIVLGQVLLFGSFALLVYAVAAWAAMATFVRWYEEPVLARRFGASYQRYREAVPAWVPRVSPWEQSDGQS